MDFTLSSAEPNMPNGTPPFETSLMRRVVRALLVLLVISSLGIAWKPVLGEGYDSLIFVVGITIIGGLEGLGIAVLCAGLTAFIFNYFISEPIFVLSFSKEIDFITPIVFLICAATSGVLSGRMHDQSKKMQQNSLMLANLFEASRKLQQVSSKLEIFTLLETEVMAPRQILFGLYRFENDEPVPIGPSPSGDDWLALARSLASGSADYMLNRGFAGWLLRGNSGVVGSLVVARNGGQLDENYMLALVQVVALALARIQLSERLADARARVQAEELKSALLASVSHDLRSPLTAINTSAASLLAFGDSYNRETMNELLGNIVEETDRLSNLTTNLLEMGRLEAGEGRQDRSVLPAGEMVRNTVARQKRVAGGRKLSFSAPREEVLIYADAVLFDLVLTNIMQNAIRYSPPDGQITVNCAVEGTDCHIAITDNGIGIPPEDQERVFERFYRVKRPGQSPRGSGLGLAIARSFVIASHGSIGITSPVRDGRGTTITIHLPQVRGEAGAGDLLAGQMDDNATQLMDATGALGDNGE